MSKKEFEKAIKEVKKYMGQYSQPQKKNNKGWLIGIGVAVLAILIGLVMWLRAKNEEDLEEYYEYFDDNMEDEELEDDELYGLIQDDIENDDDEIEDEEIEYVNLKNFNQDEED